MDSSAPAKTTDGDGPPPASVQKALERYSDPLSDPTIRVFAMLVAQGKSRRQAYMSVRPNASKATADTEGQILANHPAVAREISLHQAGAHQLGRAALPSSVEKMIRIMQGGSEGDRVQLQAARTLADRFGAPKTQQIVANARVELLDSLQDAIAGEVDDQDVDADSLPQLPAADDS